MNKIYQRIDWENYPSSATPLNEDNLNKMDYAIDKLDDRIVTHETTKLDTAIGNNLVKNVTFTERTGVFTIEKLNGSKFTINTALEKISINFYFDPTTQKLALTLIDGTVQEIDLSALITQYEFLESDTITFEIDASGKVKANILNGSITGEKLEPNYLANATLQANNAKTSADNAKTSEELAYQYAEEAKESASQTAKSDAKNITYDNTESGLSATNVKDALDEVAQCSVSAIATDTTITDSTNAPLIYGKFKGYTIQNGEPTPDAPIEIEGLDKVSVKTCGKNLINDAVLIGKNGIIDTYHEVKLKPNTTYYFVAKTTSGNGIARGYFGTYLLDKNNTKIFEYINQTDKYISEFTLTEEQANSIVKCRITANGSQPADMVITEVALSETPTYEPYKETVAEFDLTEPLYEGDYIEYRADGTGVLHKKFMNFNPTTIEAVAENVGAYIKLIKGYCKTRSTALCNYLKLDATGQTTGFNLGGNAEGNFSHFFIKVLGLTTKEEYQSWLNERSDLEVVYELATPIEIELTAEQLAQFKNLRTFEPVTNVLCEGETEIQYYKNTDSGETVAMVSKKADNSVSKSNSLENRLSKSLVSTETINIDSLSLPSGGYSTMTSDEISKSGYTLVGANFFLRGSYAENIIASFTIGGSNTKIYNFAFYNPSDYDISAYGYVDLIYVANSL